MREEGELQLNACELTEAEVLWEVEVESGSSVVDEEEESGLRRKRA